MWISKQITKSPDDIPNITTADITHAGNAEISAQAAIEYRDVPIIAPFGIAYSPPVEQSALIASVGNSNFCVGVTMPNKNLSSGDLLLYSGSSASILLKANGTIEINGNVKINGKTI